MSPLSPSQLYPCSPGLSARFPVQPGGDFGLCPGEVPGPSSSFPRGRSSPVPLAPGASLRGAPGPSPSAPGHSGPFSPGLSRPSRSHPNPPAHPGLRAALASRPLCPTCRPPVQPRSLHTCPNPRSVAAASTGAAPGRATTVRPCGAAAGQDQAPPRPAAGPAPPPPHLAPAGGTPDDPPTGPASPPHGRSPAGSDRRRQPPSAAAILGTGRGRTGSAHALPARSKEGGRRGRAP